jgi:glucose-6-phosphate-specific signal transduction histidine kinase
MNKMQKNVVIILAAVSVVGVLGIPLGDPRFIPQAIVLEGCFVSLAILTAKNYRRVYIPNFIIAGIVIVGNSAFYKHIEIMTTLHPLYNALVLITGGYVLQVLLLITNYLAYRQHKHLTLSGRTD